MPPFTPRPTFPPLLSLPRSYYLGHHAAGLTKMKTLLASIDLIVECRDYRVPLTSTNPLFEETLGERARVVVLTKRDLGVVGGGGKVERERDQLLRTLHHPTPVLPTTTTSRPSIRALLSTIHTHATAHARSIAGARVLIVGMPNVGKSSLLNALRSVGVGKGKAARTGDQPGVTRKVGTGVKVKGGVEEFGGGGIYILDTPGVFIPYVPDATAMLKLALCGCVKDGIVPSETLADYLLYQLNLRDPSLYAEYSPPTNDVAVLLEGVARRTGRLVKGGQADMEGAAGWLVQRWRNGVVGRFVLDDVSEEGVRAWKEGRGQEGMSGNQLRKMEREERRGRGRVVAGGGS
ncbi:P-loop containing nucleoside triphosphate hydrolase protein [Eremomyces bilateralis CBS 781.70]|uniref:P-loop containing nucleoside triphosphate hydrolase protein n=1 Tax=Eremomyces bilateralis CBS 781.70 TaxID=1392243 RepID=A0A6G1FR70_9PEZI|nr:P-loop containing nucleoside triphosphate hydrolase protein [Eremomyces bilateralis CBS 781.70]KAF1808228.1 P-loop containing nucleoside triphosphate hydrolase protein [Eremomyces bilateralis CBS 781.70]